MNRWAKIGIGAAIAVLVVVAAGVWALRGMNDFFYPVAPPMPAVVNESMPEILARLESVLKTNAPQVLEGLQPGLSATDVKKFEEQYHVQLPEEIEAIYEWHDGSRQTTNYTGSNFIPGHQLVPLKEALEVNALLSKGGTNAAPKLIYQVFVAPRASWIDLMDDGAGDGYFFDPKRKPAEGAVFYTFTEENNFVFFPSAKNLMAGVAKCYEQGIYHIKPGTSPPQLDEDFERADKVWGEFGASNH